MNGGVCIDGVDSFKCSCPATTSGVLCQCVSTTEGQHCQPLPYWFEDKPFQPIVPLDPKFFGTHFNISSPLNESFIEDLPSPTLAEDVTRIIDTAEFPRTVVTSDILVSSFITPTVDVFTISSVLSAKVSLVFSEVPAVTVPYFTSQLYESPLPSPSLDPFLTAMQPTPVLPVPTPSPRPEDIDTGYEYLPETRAPLPTLTLEGPQLTPSLEFIPVSLISVFDVSIFLPLSYFESCPLACTDPFFLLTGVVFLLSLSWAASLNNTHGSLLAECLANSRKGHLVLTL